MKAISASIIVVAGAILLVGGSHIGHSQTKGFVQFVGCAVGLIGMVGWGFCLSNKSDSRQ